MCFSPLFCHIVGVCVCGQYHDLRLSRASFIFPIHWVIVAYTPVNMKITFTIITQVQKNHKEVKYESSITVIISHHPQPSVRLLFLFTLGRQFLIFAGFCAPAAHCGSYANSPAAADLRVSPWQSVPPMNETCSDHLHVAYCHFCPETRWFRHGKWISPQHFLISYDFLERKLRLFSVYWIKGNKDTSI